MRKIKRLVGIALTLCMILSTVPCTSLAVETPEERNDLKGFCGAEGGNLAWEIDSEEGTLTISGTGKMADFEANEEEETSTAPWFAYAKDPPNRKDRDLEKIIVKEGVQDGVWQIYARSAESTQLLSSCRHCTTQSALDSFVHLLLVFRLHKLSNRHQWVKLQKIGRPVHFVRYSGHPENPCFV